MLVIAGISCPEVPSADRVCSRVPTRVRDVSGGVRIMKSMKSRAGGNRNWTSEMLLSAGQLSARRVKC